MNSQKITFYCIRHTQVTLKGYCYGHSDVPFGIIEPEALAALQSTIPSHALVYASPLLRCADLARRLFPATAIAFDDRLKELHFGDWENLPWDHIARDQIDAWAKQPLTYSAPNGESFQQLINRVADWKNSIAMDQYNKPIVVVTHAGVIRALAVLLNGFSVDAALSLNIPHAQLVPLRAAV